MTSARCISKSCFLRSIDAAKRALNMEHLEHAEAPANGVPGREVGVAGCDDGVTGGEVSVAACGEWWLDQRSGSR